MCTDFIDLNNTCLKYYVPMPSITKLVESAVSNEWIRLLNAYSSYHQVSMVPKDEEKIAFYVGDEIYYYVMMSFSLKNAGATYHMLVYKVFKAQIEQI